MHLNNSFSDESENDENEMKMSRNGKRMCICSSKFKAAIYMPERLKALSDQINPKGR